MNLLAIGCCQLDGHIDKTCSAGSLKIFCKTGTKGWKRDTCILLI
jgi:hypothetical protein